MININYTSCAYQSNPTGISPFGLRSYPQKSHINNTYNKNISFQSKHKPTILSEIRLKKLEEEIPSIDTIDEYFQVLKDVFNSRTLAGGRFWNPELDLLNYKNINPEFIGILPYCGVNDVSYEINSYLGGRIDYKNLMKKENHFLENTPTKSSIISIMRALDYSLGKIQETFGLYDGIVYRKGHEDSGQFVSTTKSAAIACNFNGFRPNAHYSIIETNSGYPIYKFQKSMNSPYAANEQEVLLSRKKHRQKLSPNEYNDKIQKAIKNLTTQHFFYLNFANVAKQQHLSKEDFIKNIDVYKEI